jgi:hypothetical protein
VIRRGIADTADSLAHCITLGSQTLADELNGGNGDDRHEDRSRHGDAIGFHALDGSRDIGAEVDAGNASVHAIVEAGSATAQLGTYVNGWSNASILYCADCHGNADQAAGAVAGPHASSAAPLLKAPYVGTLPGDTALLCYECHKREVYYTGVEDTSTAASWFGGATVATEKLHNKHVAVQGFSCAACHVSHGSTTELHLLRAGVGYAPTLDGGVTVGGTCTNDCHVAEPTTRTYTW